MQDSKESTVPIIRKMAKGRDRKDIPIIFMFEQEREEVWDSLYIKEEGIILEFNPDTKSGKVQFLEDNSTY